MRYDNIRNTREGFVNMRSGDKLIHTESVILGIVAFFVALTQLDIGFVPSLITAAVVIFVFPMLAGLITAFAWFVAIVFSAIWAVVAYFIGGAILGDSPVAGALIAVVVFVISFFLHKIFSGLGYSSVDKHVMDSIDSAAANTEVTGRNMQQMAGTNTGSFCSHCGQPIKPGSQFCTQCGSRQ